MTSKATAYKLNDLSFYNNEVSHVWNTKKLSENVMLLAEIFAVCLWNTTRICLASHVCILF